MGMAPLKQHDALKKLEGRLSRAVTSNLLGLRTFNKCTAARQRFQLYLTPSLGSEAILLMYSISYDDPHGSARPSLWNCGPYHFPFIVAKSSKVHQTHFYSKVNAPLASTATARAAQ